MPAARVLPLCAILVGPAAAACAHPSWGYPVTTAGTLVEVSVCVDGTDTPLYPDPRGRGRHYLEAREGARYEIRLGNRTGGRVGVAIAVDGLDVISGTRTTGASSRLYVLDPWGQTTIRGWRTSLHDVRRFTFVDEKTSYAARSGQATGRMGWIEVQVYREAGNHWHRLHPSVSERERGGKDEPGRLEEGAAAPPAPERAEDEADPPTAKAPPMPPPATAPPTLSRAPKAAEGARSYPGTGWGPQADDPVRVVAFEPAPSPADRITLRYEYASTLRALGIRLHPDFARSRDRLRERERGEAGFAKPPAW